VVLDSGIPIDSSLHVYAHFLRGVPGGVAVLLLDTDRMAKQRLNVPEPAHRYTLTATKVAGHRLQLNGTGALALPFAGNAACR
jgi:heparanase